VQVRVGSAPPDGTEMQIPCDPAALQVWQTPLQRPLQQTPCAQKLLKHSESCPHSVPSGFLPHEPLMQLFPAVQSALVVQLEPHRLLLHLLGVQSRAGGVTQAPAMQTLSATQRLVEALHV
jgi:hypothetical protein